jgi:orotate phosphoribosyltransferase
MLQSAAPLPTDAQKERLIELIARLSLLKESPVTLASGARSTFYFDMKPALLDPEAANLIADLILAAIEGDDLDYVAGVELGGVPLVAAVVVRSQHKCPMRGLIVRKEAKAHGMKRPIEGLVQGQSLKGKKIALLEDVTTTGGSALLASKALQSAGANIAKVVTIVDRLQGAAETLARAGIPLVPLFTRADFGL